MNEEQIAAEEAEIQNQRQADRYWRPLLTRWKGWLLDPARAAEATRGVSRSPALAPWPSVLRVFDGVPRWQRWAVYVLGRIDSPRSAQALATLAITAPSRETREAAINRLRTADPRAYVGLLINGMKQPTPVPGGLAHAKRSRRSGAYRRASGPDRAALPPDTDTRAGVSGAAAGPVHKPGLAVASQWPLGLFNQDVRVSSAPAGQEAEPPGRRSTSGSPKTCGRSTWPICRSRRPTFASSTPCTSSHERRLEKTRPPGRAGGISNSAIATARPAPSSKPIIVQEVAATYTPPPPVVSVTQSQVIPRPHSCFAAGTPVISPRGAPRHRDAEDR